MIFLALYTSKYLNKLFSFSLSSSFGIFSSMGLNRCPECNTKRLRWAMKANSPPGLWMLSRICEVCGVVCLQNPRDFPSSFLLKMPWLLWICRSWAPSKPPFFWLLQGFLVGIQILHVIHWHPVQGIKPHVDWWIYNEGNLDPVP